MTDSHTQSPTVRLLVRSMNRETLRAQLASLAAQTYRQCEIVVINASGAPHAPLPSLPVPARLVDPGRALGRSQAANRALDEAGGPLAMFVDDDDLLEPGHVERLVTALTCAPEAPAAYAGVNLLAQDGQVVKVLDEPWSYGKLLVRNFLPIHAVLFRMSAVTAQQCRFNERLGQLEDWDFWLQLAQAGAFMHVPGVSAHYLLHQGTSGLSAERDVAAFHAARETVYRRWLPEADNLAPVLGNLSDGLEQSQWDLGQVRHTLAAERDAFAELAAERDALLASRSMRLTAPLRQLQHRLDEVKRGISGWRLERRLQRQLPAATANQLAPNGPVDVIVPVYKGLEETRACLESVWASRPRTPYRLLVINDASPEPAVTAWLREAARSRPMTLLENPDNMGFVGTVNRGMAISSSADVVLLNSDAEVAGDWLDRLVAAAYSPGERPVASVTPFSNNATICSYPRFCQDNALPDGYDLPRLDRLFAECNAQERVEIPTAIGFCMYIRRESLNAVGHFDEAHFGKGYGEENDFCMRSLKAGWRHLHALDTFVWHKGSVSFGASQNERVVNATRVMNELHPDYEMRVHRFIQADPAHEARARVDLRRLRESPLPRVLLVSHQRGGGVERHCRQLAETAAGRVEYLMLAPAPGGLTRLSWFGQGEALALQYRLPEALPALLEMLQALAVGSVHYHHLLGHPPEVRALAKRLAVPYEVTLHDFWVVCPQITLTQQDGRYCGERGLAQCRDCLARQPAPDHADIETWRERHHHWLAEASRILAPSQDAADRVQRYYPDLAVQVAPHPEPIPSAASRVRRVPPTADEPLRVAVVGALSREKGADVVEALAAHVARHDLPIRLCLFGFAYRHLDAHGVLEVTGAYEEPALPALLAAWKPHVAWFPAQCPETWCYTLSACLTAGLPIVASDLGALPERLRGRPFCEVLPHDSAIASWAEALLSRREATAGTALPSTSAPAPFYPATYLAGLENANPSPEPLPDAWPAHLATEAPQDAVGRARHRLVVMLFAARQSRWLQPVARRIPTRMQRRVKSLLLGESS